MRKPKNGNTYAQYKLGDMYWNGFGVKVNMTQHKFGGKKLLITDIRMPNLIYHGHLNKPQCQ